jgi:hypothetical protein
LLDPVGLQDEGTSWLALEENATIYDHRMRPAFFEKMEHVTPIRLVGQNRRSKSQMGADLFDE